MTNDDARDVVLRALAEVAPEMDDDDLDPDAEFAESLDIDSMDHLNFILALNAKTGVEIPERDYPKLTTVTDSVAYLIATGWR